MTAAAAETGLHWLDAEVLELDGQRYRVTNDVAVMHGLSSTADCLALCKPQALVERYHRSLRSERPANVVELGIFKGGSTAFLHQVLAPRKLLALEVSTERVPALDAFIASRGLKDVIRPLYGIDQADRARLAATLDQEFGDERLDLVVDDASHFYAESRAAFEALFPRLRPGGRYVIEDWSWAHYHPRRFAGDLASLAERPALTNLVVEVLLVAGSVPDVVEGLHIDHYAAEIVRGERRLPEVVDLGTLYYNRGRAFRPLL